jgi:hypothetical protein
MKRKKSRNGVRNMADVTLTNFSVYIALAISAIFTGLGSAIGSWFANSILIKHSKNIFRKKKNKKEGS